MYDDDNVMTLIESAVWAGIINIMCLGRKRPEQR